MALGPQSRWRRVLLLALLPMLAAIFYYVSTTPPSFLPHASSPSSDNMTFSSDDASMMTVMKALYGPIVHPVAAPNFTDEDGETFYLPKGKDDPRFKKSLGKRVLILDVDSRPLNHEGQILGKELKWKGIKPLAAGMLSHYMYAQVHGYTYKFIHAPSYEDRWGTWTKVPMMLSAIRTRQFDYIVFMDSDVVMHYPHLPIEWLLNYWDVQPGMLAAMSIDPDEPQNYDVRGNRYLNTGFVILQNDRDHEGNVDGVEGKESRLETMLTRWAECPDEGYKHCKRWKGDWPHEQAAFGTFVRYDPLFSSRPSLAAEKAGAPPENTYAKGEAIKVLPCVEANGAPEAENRGGCKGLFVRHYWVDKSLVASAVSDGILQYWMPRLHHGLIDSGNIVDAKGFQLHGAEAVELHGEAREGARKGKGTGSANLKEEGW
ncbi:hypothetical protein K491DRAFT_599445 [Lophiostoma macrostomum CBS 122681]|uniref:Nucleotide-diphospho-sugar transferase domain-containing protein n=1 Tax=Lophiostoma macrostomum CBS 122681 TaxID=1314788 RepID=A0A6A6T674_9PLEO|nr:hypothetical protein K491DRAFT_599445 [Lophiostoma macrostomum CBS 122681]